MQIVIDIPEDHKRVIDNLVTDGKGYLLPKEVEDTLAKAVKIGIPLPEGHGRLKDEDEIIRAIEDRVKFLRENDAVFMRLHKDIDILGCIPKIRCEVPTIIEADEVENEKARG